MLPGCCSGHSPSEYASPHTFPSNLIKWLSDLSFSLVLLNWHCFLVKFCRWIAHVFLLRAEPAGHLRWNMREPCKFLGLRLPQRSPNCEIVSSPDWLWNPAMQPAGCAAIPAPCQLLSFHCHAVSVLNATETAASYGWAYFLDWYPGCLLWQCPVPCSSLRMFAHVCTYDTSQLPLAFFVFRVKQWPIWTAKCIGLLWPASSAGKFWLRRWLWAWQLSMSKTDTSFTLCSTWLFCNFTRSKASSSFGELCCTYLMPIEIKLTTTSDSKCKWTLDQDRKWNTSRKR